jgi:hypothetical protein
MRFFLIILAAVMLSACQNDHRIGNNISFYHWGSKWNPNQTEIDLLNKLSDVSSNRIYVHLFDLKVIDSTVQKVSSLEMIQSLPAGYCAVPVVYIENKVFEQHDDSLANKVYEVVARMSRQQNFCVQELQIDCDWSEKTKDAYFLFLKKIKDNSNWKITATIRLHQIKFYKRTGVPPVDKGVLMYYNMGKIAADNRNSILDNQIGEQYLDQLDQYPLTLDLALPCFQWWIQLRNGQPIALISKWNHSPKSANDQFESNGLERYRVKSAGFYSGHYLQEGDVLKLEKSDETQVIQAARILQKRIREPFEEVIFFELDSTHISSFDASFFSSFILRDSTNH